MDFLSWILAGMAVGYAIHAITGCASSPQQVYTGTEPTIYATDQVALIPEPPDPVWFDWRAPLNLDGLNFANDPDTPPGL